MKKIAVIPARLGSQRLKKKNLKPLCGKPLITRAIHKCIEADCFDEIYVNSESLVFKEIAEKEGVNFYHRAEHLGNNSATSEDFISDFLQNIDCSWVFQVHSIAPLLTAKEVESFVSFAENSDYQSIFSCIEDQIEVAYMNSPVNFNFSQKTNSQDLKPVQRITWSISGWKKESFLDAINKNKCATYNGKIGFFKVSPISGHVIKTKDDLKIAEAYASIGYKI